MSTSQLRDIPTHLVAGPLGAGKTTLLRALMDQRPADERWAILVNEFGQVGIDAALLDRDASPGLAISEIPGGCLCCVNGLPFQVGLGRLLKKARPDRLFIETSGLGHPGPLLGQLAAPPWDTVLQLQPLLMVIDAAALAAGNELPPAQAEALPLAGVLLMNKAENLDEPARTQIIERMPDVEVRWCTYGKVDLASLPAADPTDKPGRDRSSQLPEGTEPLPTLMRSPHDWQRFEQNASTGYSVGWIMRPSVCFDRHRIDAWLARVAWLRAKAVIHTSQGWQSLNALPGGKINWSAATPRRDSRLELILPSREDVARLEIALRQAVVAG